MHNQDSSSAADAVQYVYVLSDIDGFKYKLVMEGDVRLLTGEKVKRYLEKATGLSPEHQSLTLDGRPVPDDSCGEDLDLHPGATLRLQHARHAISQSARACAPNPTAVSRSTSACVARENAQLVERLADAERRLANAQPDWRLQEEVEAQRAAVVRLERERDEAQRVAAAQWRAKEEELVRELDLLREERRRARRDEEQRTHEQRAVVHALEGRVRALQEELRTTCEKCEKCPDVAAAARANLQELSRVLCVEPPLQFDSNDTCALPAGLDGLSVLVTFDEPSARVFVYATIASELPAAPGVRLRLYEALLEGALLGRDTAGAGVGVCRENGLVIMSIAVDVAHADDGALAAVAEPFIAAAQMWAEKVKAIAEEDP